jgi:hypothetical protein
LISLNVYLWKWTFIDAESICNFCFHWMFIFENEHSMMQSQLGIFDFTECSILKINIQWCCRANLYSLISLNIHFCKWPFNDVESICNFRFHWMFTFEDKYSMMQSQFVIFDFTECSLLKMNVQWCRVNL